MAAVLTPLVSWLLVRGPEALGLGPDGGPPETEGTRPAAGERAGSARDFLRTSHFWSVALAFALGLTAQISLIIHQMSFLKPLIGARGAALAVSLTSISAVLGRLIVGLFIDRVNRRAVVASNFLLQAAAVTLMLAASAPALLYVACVMFGLGVGNTTSLPSVLVQAEFPRAVFGRVVSTIIAINQVTILRAGAARLAARWIRQLRGSPRGVSRAAARRGRRAAPGRTPPRPIDENGWPHAGVAWPAPDPVAPCGASRGAIVRSGGELRAVCQTDQAGL